MFTPVYEKLPDPDNPENGSRKGGSSGTNTGDSTNVALWIGLLAAAGIGFGTVYKRRKRSK
ncbi:MAG: LPXTG cell wall anchor domain-containing protein [Mogibacterium sp.]|nr:LPXTG cell wall anchor domain-containing protein [Mogibacterium sp.]